MNIVSIFDYIRKNNYFSYLCNKLMYPIKYLHNMKLFLCDFLFKFKNLKLFYFKSISLLLIKK